MFSYFIIDAIIERMEKTGSKSSFVAIPGHIHGHLKPLGDTEEAIANNTMADAFSFTCSSIEDIRKGDRLIIDSKKYSVQGVKDHKGIRVQFTKAILQLG